MNQEIQKLIQEFQTFDDWEEKYSYLIELGKHLPKLEESKKNPANKINGCMSQVWMVLEYDRKRLYLYVDSDALIVRGLLAIVVRLCYGKTGEEILNIDFDNLLDKLEMKKRLTPSRNNGLYHIIKKIQETARNYINTSKK